MTKKWAYVIDNETKRCVVGLGNNIQCFKKHGMEEMEVEESAEHIYYLKGYAPSLVNNSYEKKRIELLKHLLSTYDYIGVKIATGCATIEDYADEIKLCEEYRNEINELEKMVVSDGNN
jgi:sialic acid synthase SpsE